MGQWRWALLGVLIVLLVVGCHTITEELPSRPTPPVVQVPIPGPPPFPTPTPPAPAPTPGPSPTPTPTPAPQPTPTPTPSSTPPPSSCAPAPASGRESCSRLGSSQYLSIVEAASDDVIRANPGWFRDEGPYKMKLLVEEGQYNRALISAINRRGACAGYYAEEISVRKSGDFSENFDVLTGDYYLWRGAGSYRSTCVPASTTSE